MSSDFALVITGPLGIRMSSAYSIFSPAGWCLLGQIRGLLLEVGMEPENEEELLAAQAGLMPLRYCFTCSYHYTTSPWYLPCQYCVEHAHACCVLTGRADSLRYWSALGTHCSFVVQLWTHRILASSRLTRFSIGPSLRGNSTLIRWVLIRCTRFHGRDHRDRLHML